MVRTLLGIFLFLAGVALTNADGKVTAPRGPQPKQVLARMDSGAALQIRTFVPEVKAVQQKVKTTVDGKVREVTITRQEIVVREITQKLDIKKVQAIRADGKKVSSKDLGRLLKKETPILLSTNGKPIDRFYLLLVKKDTLVLVTQTGETDGDEPILEDEPQRPTPRKGTEPRETNANNSCSCDAPAERGGHRAPLSRRGYTGS